MRLLILGGTTEASRLGQALADRRDVDAIVSLAGRTENPLPPPIPYRVGGFGGAEGLASYLQSERIEAVLDATHPFAARISANAVAACARMLVPLVAYSRPAWKPQAGDRWIAARDMADSVERLGATPRHVFVTTGRLDLAAFQAAPQHSYLIRTIDPPDPADLPPDHRLIFARPPFTEANEINLMRSEDISILVTKNSGGTASAAKLSAARALGLPVIIVDRPRSPGRLTLHRLEEALAWIDAHQPRP